MNIFRVIDEDCKPPTEKTESPEDDEFADIQIKIPETEQMSEDESIPTPVPQKEINTEEIFERFKEQEAIFENEIEDQSLFTGIEEEEEKRKIRKEADHEKMSQSPDESFEIEDNDDQSCSSVSVTQENLVVDPPIAKKDDNSEKKFCCKKHRQLFMESASSIRLCATRQLYEQVSCDEPESTIPAENTPDKIITDKNIESDKERDMKLWEKPKNNKIQGYRNTFDKTEYNAHEADITGKLLNRRQNMNPAKVKGLMIETNEQDIEEISSGALPAVCHEPNQTSLKSAFLQESVSSEQEEEIFSSGETQFTHFQLQRLVQKNLLRSCLDKFLTLSLATKLSFKPENGSTQKMQSKIKLLHSITGLNNFRCPNIFRKAQI